MRNLPTMAVVAEHSEHRCLRMCTQCLLCDNSPETGSHLLEYLVQTYEWCLARQRLHTWLSTYVGPRSSQFQSQLWDPAVLEQWLSTIEIPSLWAHMGPAGPHNMGTEFIPQLLLSHTRCGSPTPELGRASSWPAWGRGTMVWAL